jgi:hypothetical protein
LPFFHTINSGRRQDRQTREGPSIFKWETMREVGTEVLRYVTGAIPGKIYEVELTSG